MVKENHLRRSGLLWDTVYQPSCTRTRIYLHLIHNSLCTHHTQGTGHWRTLVSSELGQEPEYLQIISASLPSSFLFKLWVQNVFRSWKAFKTSLSIRSTRPAILWAATRWRYTQGKRSNLHHHFTDTHTHTEEIKTGQTVHVCVY